MSRKTVTIVTSDHGTPRRFHLEEDKANRFAASIRSEGGTATVDPLFVGPELKRIIARAGISPESIR